MSQIAVTWWGHSSATVELGSVRVATDPLFSAVLFALHREVDRPDDRAAVADLVLVSHLHYDHLHLKSLRRFAPGTPIVVPRGAPRLVRGLSRLNVIEARPGDGLRGRRGRRGGAAGAPRRAPLRGSPAFGARPRLPVRRGGRIGVVPG